MNKKEKELFLALCDLSQTDKDRLEGLLSENATPSVLGQLFFNRMQSAAYVKLRDNGLLGRVNRELRNSLRDSHRLSLEKNESFEKGLCFLNKALEKTSVPYAMLKGALLCGLYPKGVRTCNDIDLLVLPEDVTQIGNALKEAGFRQGYIRNEVFVPAQRKDIVASKMMRGETIPYVYEIGLPFMKHLEIDVNYSVDYKNSDDDIVCKMLENRRKTAACELCEIITLDTADFFIHLCCHLYKEATTYPWVSMGRDMTLYKYSDIQYYLSKLTEDEIKSAFERAEQLSAAEICACVVLWTSQLFEDVSAIAVQQSVKALEGKEDMLDRVIDPKENKLYSYTTSDVRKRFFTTDRIKLLKECSK